MPSGSFANAVIVLYVFSVLLGAILYLYWRRPHADELDQTRAALTSILAFIVWWSFLTGHVANNIMGFGS